MPFKMTLPKLSVLTFLLFILFACHQTAKQSDNVITTDTTNVDTTKTVIINSIASTKKADSSIDNEDTEDKIIDTIFKLTEVKERAKYIEEQTKGKRHLKIWVEGTPNLPDQKYYWIKAGEDNGTNLVTHFNFYVYPDSMRIMYYDTQSDSELTLNQWRKINGM
jgi:hypothetical protein